MKLKKLFAGVVAVAMMATMAFPAFAAMGGSATVNNEGTARSDTASIVLKKEYNVLNPGTTSPAETFTFSHEKTSVKNAGKGITKDNMPDITVSDVAFIEGAAGSEHKTGDVTITLPEYTSVGVYTYTITENNNNNAGVAYRTEPITVVVTVVNDDNSDSLVRIPVIHIGNAEAQKGDTFTDNTYKAGTLKVEKQVKGTQGNKSKDFAFTLTLTGEEGKTYPETGYSVMATAVNDNTLTQLTNIKIGETKTFYLHDDATLVINNLPYNVGYTITETDYTATGDDDEHGYTTKVNGEVGLKAEGTIENSANNVEFENSKGGTIDTGVILDNAPYILMLAVVAGGAMTLVIKKRREEE